MKLRYSQRAKRDLDSIGDYIRERNPEAALRVRAAIVRSLRTLVMFPHIGRQQNALGVRKLVRHRYPYLVYYVVDDSLEEIVILTIQHPARDRPSSDA